MLRLRKGITIILVLALVGPHLVSLEATNVFTFQGKNALHLNIETHKTTEDGWTPVVLFIKELEISLWMDANGRVTEFRNPESRSDYNLFRIDEIHRYLIIGDNRYPLIAKRQSPIRTRFKIPDTDVRLALMVDQKNNKVSLLLGNSALHFMHIRAEFIEAQAGTRELKIRGPRIRSTRRFIYMEDTGSIYSARLHQGPVDLSKSRIWATQTK